MTAGIDDLLAEARRSLIRLSPAAAAQALEAGARMLDIRDSGDIARDGLIPGALVIPRNVFEWRVDPRSAHRHPAAPDVGDHVIVVCLEGYQSSLVAATMQRFGFTRATDLIDGFLGWRAAGLPVVPAARGLLSAPAPAT